MPFPLILILSLLLAFAAAVWITCIRLSSPPRITPTRDPGAVGLSFEPVEFQSSDGMALRGWWIAANGSPANGSPAGETPEPPASAVLVHPYGGNRSGLKAGTWARPGIQHGEINFLPLASQLHQAGFNVLMFDLRGHGESAAGHCAGGFNEDQDVSAAVHYTIERVMREYNLLPTRDERVLAEEQLRRTPRMGVIGYGLGATAALVAVGRKKGGTEIFRVFSGDAEGGFGYADILPDEIKRLRFLVLIEPCSLAGVVQRFLRPLPTAIARLFCGFVDWLRQSRGDYPMGGALLERFASQVNVPTLFMRGARDDWGTRAEVERLYRTGKATKRLVAIEERGRMNLLIEPSSAIEEILAFTVETCEISTTGMGYRPAFQPDSSCVLAGFPREDISRSI